jgi:outer membrane murein-binding lipoprotein Lpp
MFTHKRTRLAGIVLVAALALGAALLAGCSSASSPTTTTKTGSTALGGLTVAKSALSTQSPDAKLLVVETAQAVEPTGTPIWAYIFGSPSTDKIFVVYLTNGQAMGAQESGTAGLSAAEWAKVPATTEWKIDSDVAYKSALAASGAKGTPAAYMMGFVTYKAAADTSTIEPMVWNVQFDPGTSGASDKTVLVNATTGAASIAK